jgi:hypothetical protein
LIYGHWPLGLHLVLCRPFAVLNQTNLLQHTIWLTTMDDSKLSEETIEELKTELVWLLRAIMQISDQRIELFEIEHGHPLKRKNKISDERVEAMTRELNEKEKNMKKIKSIFATKVFDLLQKFERKVAVFKHHQWLTQKAEEGEKEGWRVVPM